MCDCDCGCCRDREPATIDTVTIALDARAIYESLLRLKQERGGGSLGL